MRVERKRKRGLVSFKVCHLCVPKTYTLQALYTEVLPAGGRLLVEVGSQGVPKRCREVPVLGFSFGRFQDFSCDVVAFR